MVEKVKISLIRGFLVPFLFVFVPAPPAPAENQPESGLCLRWAEGDSLYLLGCERRTRQKCRGPAKPFSKEDTAFGVYKGDLYRDGAGTLVEYRRKSPRDWQKFCKGLFVKQARQAEAMMSSQWGRVVWSGQLRPGDGAVIFGGPGMLRHAAGHGARVVAELPRGTRVKILKRSDKEGDPAGGSGLRARWFLVGADGKRGWIFGRSLHPDPSGKESFID